RAAAGADDAEERELGPAAEEQQGQGHRLQHRQAGGDRQGSRRDAIHAGGQHHAKRLADDGRVLRAADAAGHNEARTRISRTVSPPGPTTRSRQAPSGARPAASVKARDSSSTAGSQASTAERSPARRVSAAAL